MAFQHLCYLEVDIEVAPDVELWQGQDIILLAKLVCDAVLPVEDSRLEVLCEFGCEDMHVILCLKDICPMVYLEIGSRELVPCSQICVVAYEVPPYTDGCLCLREGDGSSEVGGTS